MQRLFRRRRGGKPVGPWLAWFYDRDGNRKQRSTRCRDRRAAELVASKWERDHADPASAIAAKATVTMMFRVMLAALHERVTKDDPDLAESTRQSRELHAGHFCAFLGDEFLLARLTPGTIDDYVTHRRAWVTDHTISKELVTLRIGLHYAKRRGLWAGDIEAIIPKMLANYTPRERFATRDDARDLLRALDRDRAGQVAFMIATSSEKTATQNALRADIHMKKSGLFALVRGTKNAARWRHVPITTEWQHELIEFALDMGEGEGDRLFRPWGNVTRDLASACRFVGCLRTNCERVTAGHDEPKKAPCERADCKAAALAPLTPNDFRRTFAQWMREDEIALELIAPQMGHKSTTMLQRVYGRLDPDALARRMQLALPDRSNSAAARVPSAAFPGPTGQAEGPVSSGKTGAPGRNRTCDIRLRRGGGRDLSSENRIDRDGDAAIVQQVPGQLAALEGWSLAVESSGDSETDRGLN